MGKIIVRDSEAVEPTLFKGRESRRLISPERDGSKRMSLHLIHRFVRGLGNANRYPENDEILYFLEGEGYLLEGEESFPFKAGMCAFIPADTTYKIYSRTDVKMLAILSPSRYREEWKSREDIVKMEPPLKE